MYRCTAHVFVVDRCLQLTVTIISLSSMYTMVESFVNRLRGRAAIVDIFSGGMSGVDILEVIHVGNCGGGYNFVCVGYLSHFFGISEWGRQLEPPQQQSLARQYPGTAAA